MCMKIAKVLDNLVVATDDQRFFDAVEAFNGNVTMTDKHLTARTDVLKRSIYGKAKIKRLVWYLIYKEMNHLFTRTAYIN